MAYETIYDDGSVVVEHDTTDEELPIGITVYDEQRWIDREDARKLAFSIAKTMGDSVPLSDPPESESFNESILRLAMAHGREVSFRYAKGKGTNIETRRLLPQRLDRIKDHLTVVGHDPDRDDVRAYRVDRVKGNIAVA